MTKRIHGLLTIAGFAFFLALNSFTLWNMFSFSDGGMLGAAAQTPLSLGCFLGNALGFLVLIPMRHQGKHEIRGLLIAFVVMLASGFLLLLLSAYVFHDTDSPLAMAMAGVFIGTGTTAGFFFWAFLLADEDLMLSKERILWGSALMVIPTFIFHAVPDTVMLPVVCCALLPLCFLFMTGAYRSRPAWRRHENRVSSASETGPAESTGLMMDLKRLWPSLLCIVMLAVICPAISQISTVASETSPWVLTFISCSASILVVLIMALMWFVLRRRVDFIGIYLWALPFVSGAFLLFLIAGEPFGVISNTLGSIAFCAASVILIPFSLEYAQKHPGHLAVVFGLTGGTLYLSRMAGFLTAFAVRNAGLEEQMQAAVVIALLLYVFLVVTLIATHNLKNIDAGEAGGGDNGEPADLLARQCATVAALYGLPEREAQVLELQAHGRSIANMAKTLMLSENTIRTYNKRLYATLDVHSRQELIDIIESVDLG